MHDSASIVFLFQHDVSPLCVQSDILTALNFVIIFTYFFPKYKIHIKFPTIYKTLSVIYSSDSRIIHNLEIYNKMTEQR